MAGIRRLSRGPRALHLDEWLRIGYTVANDGRHKYHQHIPVLRKLFGKEPCWSRLRHQSAGPAMRVA
jgi:hypothetical protein